MNALTLAISSTSSSSSLSDSRLSSDSRASGTLQLSGLRLVRPGWAGLAGIACGIQVCADSASNWNLKEVFFASLKF